MESGDPDRSEPQSQSRQRFVSQVEQPARARSHFAVAHGEINPADIDAALSHLKNDGVVSGRLFCEHRAFHESMGVAAGDEIDAVDLFHDLRIAYLARFRVRIVTEVRHADYQLAFLTIS
jgi:hypothetical protein